MMSSAATVCAAAWPRVARATGGLDIEEQTPALHQVRVLLGSGVYGAPQQLDAWHFLWNGATYRGTAATVVLPDRRSGLVATLPLDDYLYGVLSKEIGAAWSPASQQAQAIVARTYALHKLRPDKPYDVTAGDADQNYGGFASETDQGRAAVDATAGVIVTYGGVPARVAYSACCGGRTADAGDVWGTPYPYLVSIVDPNCVGTPNFDWHADVPVDLLNRTLGSGFTNAGALRGVSLRVDAPNARPRAIDFTGTVTNFETPVTHFRDAVGPATVRSTFVHTAALDNQGTTVALTGTGHGHGVGLCQWGARMLGEGGANAAQIVAFYFPGTSFGRG
ncbi:MAG: SpoIID/LytB domain-containing protein [Candidatus Eremiobacteraeota bacterium]|nr:SpoIID/LytB domain-containing protein [Candidatus Eremiobacteraeota bacterium]MBC5823128.1 SpoIID/LytB domain-containing protein [Candidatus Eremiobacteraeota bacterium]